MDANEINDEGEVLRLRANLSNVELEEQTVLKINFNGEIHFRFVNLSAFSLDKLTEFFVRAYDLASQSFVVQYTTNEGDRLTVTSQADYEVICRLYLSGVEGDVYWGGICLCFDAVSCEAIRKLRMSRASDDEPPPPKLSSFDMPLKRCRTRGNLPQEGEFLDLFDWTDADCGRMKDIKAIQAIVRFTGSQFYVRKEIPRNFIGRSSTREQSSTCSSISWGVLRRPVVWYGQVGQEPRLTRLFYGGQYYEWLDSRGRIYELLYQENVLDKTWWLCLDRLDRNEIMMQWKSMYKLLAASQFLTKSVKEVDCLLPYWKQDDLADLARLRGRPKESDVAGRYFVSGGSLCDFLSKNARKPIDFVLGYVANDSAAESLLAPFGCSSVEEIERFRMLEVLDTTKSEQYVNPDNWRACISSMYVLQRLVVIVVPRFYRKLVKTGSGINDIVLEGVAREAYFHALISRGHPMRLMYCKYNNVNRTKMLDWKAIMKEEMGTINCGRFAPQQASKPLEIKSEGANVEECVDVMKRWASNTAGMDYWIPETNLCETVDAVAKWTLEDGQERYCFLLLTTAEKRRCDADILWKLAKPFVDEGLLVCYIAILLDMTSVDGFRLDPVELTNQDVVAHIPLYVATYKLGEDHKRRNLSFVCCVSSFRNGC